MIKTFEQFGVENKELDKLKSLCVVVEDKFNYIMDLKNHEADKNPDVAYHPNPEIAMAIYSTQKDLPNIIKYCKEFIESGGSNKAEMQFYFNILTMYNDTLGDDY